MGSGMGIGDGRSSERDVGAEHDRKERGEREGVEEQREPSPSGWRRAEFSLSFVSRCPASLPVQVQLRSPDAGEPLAVPLLLFTSDAADEFGRSMPW